jgi:hypothetical protein
MPTFNFIQPPPNSTGRKVRVVTVDTDKDIPVGCQADPDDAAAVSKVTNAAPAANAYGGVVRIPEPGSAALTQPAQSASTGVVLAANANRRGFVIENAPENDIADLFLAFAATASTSAYTKKLRPGESWERRGGYTGVISGIWSEAGAGSAKVTEESQ